MSCNTTQDCISSYFRRYKCKIFLGGGGGGGGGGGCSQTPLHLRALRARTLGIVSTEPLVSWWLWPCYYPIDGRPTLRELPTALHVHEQSRNYNEKLFSYSYYTHVNVTLGMCLLCFGIQMLILDPNCSSAFVYKQAYDLFVYMTVMY